MKKGLICKDIELTEGIFPYTSADCVFNENNESLDEILSNISDTKIPELNNALDDLSSRVDVKVLWTNSSPISSFSQQSLNIDYTAYDFLNIVFKQEANPGSGAGIYYDSVVIPTVPNNTYIFTSIKFSGSGNNVNIARACGTYNSRQQFAFQDACKFSTYATYTTDNTMLIPIRIIGIKKKSEQ